MPSSQIDVRPLKRIDHLLNTPVKVVATRLIKIEAMYVFQKSSLRKK